MKKIVAHSLAGTFAVILTLTACTRTPHNPCSVEGLPDIYPDYIGVTIPSGIAPLNFNVTGNKKSVYVEVRGSLSEQKMTAKGPYARFNIKAWRKLTEANKGGQLEVTVSVKSDGKWEQYESFPIFVSNMPLQAWGVTYRRIEPGYEVYGTMGIYQRNLSNFNESIIFQNTQAPGACMNCHTPCATNPNKFTFHVRGSNGATLVSIDGQREWLQAVNDSIKGSMVYPYWHPSGQYCAYSTNRTGQYFHSVSEKRIEVTDQSSDVFVYNPATHELILDTLLMAPDKFETYPSFSPDGKTLYFCSSESQPIPEKYDEVRYDICRIDFNPECATFGDQIDTLFNASAMGKSAVHPRPSYDGKYLMFTLSDYGCFPIWHKEADNWLLDLSTGQAFPMIEANSDAPDSWHNWSADSHWFVFTSRRDDGLHTRLYIASVDDEGQVSKPFMLPQKNPQRYYDRLLQSYNTPDFTLEPVNFNARKAGREIFSDRRITTIVRDFEQQD